jgi:hypothetical protein
VDCLCDACSWDFCVYICSMAVVYYSCLKVVLYFLCEPVWSTVVCLHDVELDVVYLSSTQQMCDVCCVWYTCMLGVYLLSFSVVHAPVVCFVACVWFMFAYCKLLWWNLCWIYWGERVTDFPSSHLSLSPLAK